MYKLRDYQQEAVDSALEYYNMKTSTRKPLIVAPTGAGKSLIIAAIADNISEPIVVLQPSKELLMQNYEKYVSYGNEASIYSASLGKKELGHVTFATIGSIKNVVATVKRNKCGLIIVDEAHLQSKNGSVMSNFIKESGVKRIIGLTATPIELRNTMFGSSLVMINRSRKNLFNEICHVTQISEIIEKGFWSDIVYNVKETDESKLQLNTTGSDFTDKSLSEHYNQNSLESRIINEVENCIERGKKSILIFCPSIADAESLENKIEGCYAVHSKVNKKERNEIVEGFKKGTIKIVSNVNVLSVGFDHPALDTIIMARPTNSFAVFYQQAGRGVRICEGKENVEIIDFSGNINRFGTLEDLQFIKGKKGWGMFFGDKQLTSNPVHEEKEQYNNGEKVRKIWFGKHQGEKLTEIPKAYLEWLTGDEFTPNNPKTKALVSECKEVLEYHNKNTITVN